MIGGNITAELQIRSGVEKNSIGEKTPQWKTVEQLTGWLDTSQGDSTYQTYYAKVQDSTHIFVGDYVPLDKSITSENSRMIINGKVYDVKLIDNPMEMNRQLEIYLKYTGGQ